MPFDVYDHAWANARFGGMDLRARNRYSQDRPGRQPVCDQGRRALRGRAIPGALRGPGAGWLATRGQGGHQPYSGSIPRPDLSSSRSRGPWISHDVLPGEVGAHGGGVLAGVHGQGRSVPNVPDCRGTRTTVVGLRLLADGEEVAVWRGVNWEAFEMVIYPLRQLAGRELQLEIFNHEIGDRPRLMLDHVMLVRRES